MKLCVLILIMAIFNDDKYNMIVQNGVTQKNVIHTSVFILKHTINS